MSLWGLLIAALQTTFSLTDTEAPQPVYILAGVIAPAASSAASEWQRSESLAEPEPARAYAECIGGLSDCPVLLWEHTDMLDLPDKSR